MSQVRVHNFSISLDGFGTGEGIMFDAPFGHAGHRLHEWCFATRFGTARGPRSAPTTSGGVGGDRTRPFHTPVFVLTHHARPPIEMEGGTVFHFVDASPQEALDLARDAAGDLDVRIGGGPTVVRDFLAADLLDTLHVVQVPILRTN